jgi:hypothetical protein
VALIEAENTSAVLELYTQFLKCFVSATEAIGPEIEKRNPGVGIGSIESMSTTQNAGCTMAIHADCTKARNHNFINLLICMNF